MHVLHTFANNSSVPYLTWFAERAKAEGNIRYTFLIMYKERPAMIDEMAALGFDCEWIHYDPDHRKMGLMKAFLQLWRYMVRYKPDIVHCNLFDDTLPGLIAAKMAGVKIRVTTRQDTGFHWMHARRWVALDRFNRSMSTHIIAISEESRQFMIKKEQAPPAKLTLVHNGIPPATFTRQHPEIMDMLSRRFSTIDRYPVIGTVARFIEWKGYRHIVEAAVPIVEKYPKALFLFCGEGDQQDEIREFAHRSGLVDHVIFTGWIDREHMPSFYGLLDLYLHAAILEPFGLVYAEAMMNGIPIVSTSTGAAHDAINDGENGFLAAERSAAGLADTVDRALNSSDLERIGLAGKATAMTMFPFENMWRDTINVYKKALGAQK